MERAFQNSYKIQLTLLKLFLQSRVICLENYIVPEKDMRKVLSNSKDQEIQQLKEKKVKS